MNIKILKDTICNITTLGKGILAADESANTMKKRFLSINLEPTEENIRFYRELLFTTPNLNRYISGVILFEETLYQKTSKGKFFSQFLSEQGVIPGIKVDKGLTTLPTFPEYSVTEGLDKLSYRLEEYKKQGVKFAKWRAVFPVLSKEINSRVAIKINADILARYAAICQSLEIVPIVEPEILMEGSHNIEQCAFTSRDVFAAVFSSLIDNKVALEGIILKPNMILPGINCGIQSDSTKIANMTIAVLRETVPAAVPAILFLSGGQSSIEATTNLNNINSDLLSIQPWHLSFSYGRALQEDALKIWNGDNKNTTKAQLALYKRSKLNSLAALGRYRPEMEQEQPESLII